MRAAIFLALDEILKSHINPFDIHQTLLFMYPNLKWFPAINATVYIYSHVASDFSCNDNPMLTTEELNMLCRYRN